METRRVIGPTSGRRCLLEGQGPVELGDKAVTFIKDLGQDPASRLPTVVLGLCIVPSCDAEQSLRVSYGKGVKAKNVSSQMSTPSFFYARHAHPYTNDTEKKTYSARRWRL